MSLALQLLSNQDLLLMQTWPNVNFLTVALLLLKITLIASLNPQTLNNSQGTTSTLNTSINLINSIEIKLMSLVLLWSNLSVALIRLSTLKEIRWSSCLMIPLLWGHMVSSIFLDVILLPQVLDAEISILPQIKLFLKYWFQLRANSLLLVSSSNILCQFKRITLREAHANLLLKL